MSLISKVLNRKAWSYSFWFLVAVLGIISYKTVQTDLFPDTVPPQIIVMTINRHSSAEDINRQITRVLDRELKGLASVKKIYATSRDEISSINAEFEYGTNLGKAMNDAINAVNRVKNKLPSTASSLFFQVTDANRPIMTISISPKDGSSINLSATRLLAENDIAEEILRQPGVGQIDIFGANQLEVLINMDLNKLRIYSLSPEFVMQQINSHNFSIPSGYYSKGKNEFLLKVANEAEIDRDFANLPIAFKADGIIKLGDLASVGLATAEARSIYHGNGEEAIALNVLKPEGGNAVTAIKSVKSLLPKLTQKFPELNFYITTDQEPIISVNVEGMKGALFSAIWLTMLIVFLFLGEWRTSLIIGISIPLAFLSAFAFLYFTDFSVNMVTMSALIIAVGMVVDASIVVVENVFRIINLKGANEKSVIEGTDEVIFSIWGGVLTTVGVMIPIMFVGGYPQQVLRPLTSVITATLIGSFIAAITIVPILLKKFFLKKNCIVVGNLQNPGKYERFITYILKHVSDFYLSLLHLGLKARIISVIAVFMLLVFSARTVIPIIGRELMPRMDTGQVVIKADLNPTTKIEDVEKVIEQVEQIIKQNTNVTAISTVAGSETGQVSFGAGGQLLQQFEMQVTLTQRDKRSETIWEITQEWRDAFSKIPELINYSVIEFGATPMATTRAPIDLVISGEEHSILFSLAQDFISKLSQVRGLSDLRLNWTYKPETIFKPDIKKVLSHQLSPQTISNNLKLSLNGVYSSNMKLQNFNDLPVRARTSFLDSFGKERDPRESLLIKSNEEIFLNDLGKWETKLVPTLLSREDLHLTISILGNNSYLPLSAVSSSVAKIVKEASLPAGYSARLAGTTSDMEEVGNRMGSALLIGLLILYIILYLLFECYWRPLLVMSVIPLSLIGALWGMVLFQKPMCMPAMMGLILLGGTIVNNAIILIDFIDMRRKEGLNKRDALDEAIKTRLRPVLITTFSTIIGLMPLTFEQAVGLERMSPLGVSASLGLFFGTLLTMVMIPLMYDLVSEYIED